MIIILLSLFNQLWNLWWKTTALFRPLELSPLYFELMEPWPNTEATSWTNTFIPKIADQSKTRPHFLELFPSLLHWTNHCEDSQWHRARAPAPESKVKHDWAWSSNGWASYVLGFAPTMRFLRSQILCRLYKSFEWDYKPRSPMQKGHISTFKIL